MKNFYRLAILTLVASLCFGQQLEAQTATLKIDSETKHQRITGFGGFVNGPQFQYNHMTTAQIRQLWGTESEMGYNIMRLYIPVGENNWSQVIPTAKLANSLGIKIFASPWSMPAEWKTNNHIHTIHNDVVGYLKEEHYEDYAHYLNNFVELLRNNGVELTAISIQNEPDYTPSYAGCRWSPEQMASFIRDYGHIISAPIMAAEGVGITDNYANAFLPDEVFNNLGIFAGHQYGAIQSAHKKLQEKGMEVWQSEFLINWNENQATDRNFNWSIDAFSFAKAINTALLNDINAWVHYASKRYYAMMGDGLHGTQYGAITKRGYILSHFAKYTTGTTRISSTWTDFTNKLEGSGYLTISGDSIIVKVINPTDDEYSLTVDLPFFTNWGNSITTTINSNMVQSSIELNQETFRPQVTIAASSFTTLIFRKSGEKPASQMAGQAVYYNPIEEQVVTNTAFGSGYQLSGATKVFDNSRPLISNFSNANNGYLKLNDQFTKLVFNIESITSAATFTSANTTLYYINNNGQVRSHNYGTITFNPSGSSMWVLDISRNTLPDGCTGIIGITNGNWTSVLTINFGDVFFMMGDERTFKFTGEYSEWDSNLLDALEDKATTSIDFTETMGITPDMNWNAIAANKNAVYFVSPDVQNKQANVIMDKQASELVLSNHGNFYLQDIINATSASYTRNFDGYELLVLPFEAQIPFSDNLKIYTLQHAAGQVNGTRLLEETIPANTPVLLVGNGEYTFTGAGEVSTPPFLTANNNLNGVYISRTAPASTYALDTINGGTSFKKVEKGSEPTILPFTAYLDLGNTETAPNLPIVLDDETNSSILMEDKQSLDKNNVIYDLMGRTVSFPRKGVIYIVNGQKTVFY